MPIIINGGSGCAGGWWSKHLQNDVKNDRAQVVEFSGLSAETLPEAFREMQGLAAGTRCKNYFYQANINPRADEQLTPAQWREAVDTLEHNLGLTGQPRFVVEHEKNGRTHRHVVWARADAEREVVISDSLTAPIHERTSRALEIKFDLERGKSVLTPDRDFERPERRPRNYETFRAGETGIDPEIVKAELRSFWERADNGQSFKAALEASNQYVLARGDRRAFVVIDLAGDEHSLARRLGVKAAEVRGRMADIDQASLPSVAEAKAQMRVQQPEKEIERETAPAARYDALRETEQEVRQAQHKGRYDDLRAAEPPSELERMFTAEAGRTTEPDPYPDRDAAEAEWLDQLVEASIARAAEDDRRQSTGGRPAGGGRGEDTRPLGKTDADIRLVWALTRTESELHEALEERGIRLAVVSPEEARESERAATEAKALGKFSAVWREGEIVAVNGLGYVRRLTERNTGDAGTDIAARLGRLDRSGLLDIAHTKEAVQEASRAAWIERQRREAEQGRPPSGIEKKIADTLAATMTGYEFAEALDKAGLTITRVSASDVKTLDAERSAAILSSIVEHTNDETSGPRYLGRVAEGDFAAVTRHGDVFRISPHKLDFEEIEQRLLDTQPRLPSVTEARALHQLNPDMKAELWERHQAFNLERSMAQLETHRALNDQRHATQEFKNTVHDVRDGLTETGGKVANVVGRGLMSVARAAFDFLEGLFSPPPPLTKDQAERRERVAEEEAQHAARREHETEQENHLAAVNEQISEQNRERHPDFHNRFPGLPRRPDEPEPDRGRERER